MGGSADCMAEACGKYPRSAGREASKRNRTTRFTAILLKEIPYGNIESQVEKKVSENYYRHSRVGGSAVLSR